MEKYNITDKYTIIGKKIIFVIGFNETLELYEHIVLYMTHIEFGYFFDKPIVLTPYVVYLWFGHYFDHPIVLTKGMRVLTFGKYFNQMIDLTKRIKCLTFGEKFSCPIILSKNIKKLVFGWGFNRKIDLPKCTYSVAFGGMYSQYNILTKNIVCLELENCSDLIIDPCVRLTHFKMKSPYCHLMENLPNGVMNLRVVCVSKKRLNNLPNDFKRL